MQKFHKRMNVPVPLMCLRFVLRTTLWDVKLHSKERNEDSDRRCLYTGEEDPSVKRQVRIRIWISENWGLSLQLGLMTPQGHKADMLSACAWTSGQTYISHKQKELSSTKWSQRKPMLSHEGYLMRWAAGHASRCLAKSSTGSFLCSLHNLIIHSPLKGNETSWWDPSLAF